MIVSESRPIWIKDILSAVLQKTSRRILPLFFAKFGETLFWKRTWEMIVLISLLVQNDMYAED